MLQVEHLAVFYGDVQALWDVSFQVNEGEIVTLLGANGAGKTTTLHTVSGLLRPRQGSMTFQGQALHRETSQRIVEVGLMHIAESRALFPHMTMLENLELGAFPTSWTSDRKATPTTGPMSRPEPPRMTMVMGMSAVSRPNISPGLPGNSTAPAGERRDR